MAAAFAPLTTPRNFPFTSPWSRGSVLSPRRPRFDSSPNADSKLSTSECLCRTVIFAGPNEKAHNRPRRPSTKSETRRKPDGGNADAARTVAQGLGEAERLQKVMSRLGFASRRASERLIEEGKVCVNGKMVRDQGVLVNVRRDRITVNGREVRPPEAVVWVAVHKPRGYLSVANDTSRRSVADLVPKAKKQMLQPVGNLEVDNSGLVLMTNDRSQISELSSPTNRHVKEWVVDCEGTIESRTLEPLRRGVMLDGTDTPTYPASVTIIGSGKVVLGPNDTRMLTRIEVRLRENRHHFIRRLFESVGATVVRASRKSFGPILLGSLKRGDFRYLTPNEIKALKRGVLRR